MRSLFFILFVVSVAVASFAADGKARPPIKAVGAVDLTDPAGDVTTIDTSDGKHDPGFDVVKVSIKSDGKQLAITTTLKDPPGVFASDVLKFYFDTDKNAGTGVQLTFPKIGGFEYVGELDACMDYVNGSSACHGGSSESKVKKVWAAVNLSRYKGTKEYDKDDVVDSMGFPGKKASPKMPVTGTVLQGSFDYSDLKVKPGQTIRMVVAESHGYRAEDGGFFPDILLTLK